MRDLGALPTATAVQTYRPTPTSSIKRPKDGREVLNFASGAKIHGVVFPVQYQGEWCLGWYTWLLVLCPCDTSTDKIDRSDHQYAAFPAETTKLDEPKKSEVRLQGSSGMRAVARWKFSVRGKSSEWLSFNKGEIITNIGCELNIETCKMDVEPVYQPESKADDDILSTQILIRSTGAGAERTRKERRGYSHGLTSSPAHSWRPRQNQRGRAS